MDRVRFGNTELMVSPIGLGCMSMSGCYGAQDDDECIATIRRASDLGINLLDTSSNYGEGHNQELIARAIAWVMHRPGAVIPIPSSKSRAHLEQNARAAEVKLTAEDLDRLEGICPPGAAAA